MPDRTTDQQTPTEAKAAADDDDDDNDDDDGGGAAAAAGGASIGVGAAVSKGEQLRSALERIAELEREVARAARRSVSPSASLPANGAAGLDGASKISDDDNITIDTLQSSQQQQGLIVDGVCTTCGADVPVRSSSLRAPVTRANRGRLGNDLLTDSDRWVPVCRRSTGTHW